MLRIAEGGWVIYRGGGEAEQREDIELLLRVAAAPDGRLEIRELVLDPGRPITADFMRRIRWGEVDAEINSWAARTLILDDIAGPGKGRQTTGDDIVSEVFVGADDLEVLGREQEPPDLILNPPRAPYGDAFYEKVAAVYSHEARRRRDPARFLASANRMPVSTMHRWIKEARRRGFLPPGRPGKAG